MSISGVFTTTGNVTIACHKRTMPYLEQEVKDLGFEIDETFVTGVKLKAGIITIQSRYSFILTNVFEQLLAAQNRGFLGTNRF